VVDAADRFLAALAGVTDPEDKRKIIGREFIRAFEAAARQIADIQFLVQGTLYPDVVESGGGTGTANIKSHHNVGGLPDDLAFELVEPLRTLFKDEVRAIGVRLGLPEAMVWRHPFPGPGLAIRIIGAVTPDRLAVLRAADRIAREELTAAGLDRSVWQFPVVLLADVRSVGVQGDGRTYGHPIVLRPVSSDDAMTADWSRLPYDVVARVSTRITNEVPEVNRVVLDVTSKPPGTIEWEEVRSSPKILDASTPCRGHRRPRSTRSGGRRGRRPGAGDRLLRHQYPEGQVGDQQRTAGDEGQQNEQDTGGDRVDPEVAGEPTAHAGEHPVGSRATEPLVGRRVGGVGRLGRGVGHASTMRPGRRPPLR